MRSRNMTLSNISGDISKFVIGDVILPRSNHSSSAARSYEKPSVNLFELVFAVQHKKYIFNFRTFGNRWIFHNLMCDGADKV